MSFIDKNNILSCDKYFTDGFIHAVHPYIDICFILCKNTHKGNYVIFDGCQYIEK